jgi:ADP-ribose pyrophosphatase
MIRPDELRDIEVMAEDVNHKRESFIRVRRLRLRHRYSGEQYSGAYWFDMIESPFVDAVAIVLYHIDREQGVWVGLRRGVRPSIYLRKDNPAKMSLDKGPLLIYTELVAGGIEYDDLDTIGVKGRAALEVREEAGFEVNEEDMINLGGGTFSSPGFGMEKLHYLAVQVEPDTGSEPIGDGHPLEEVGEVKFYKISEAISWCRLGKIEDSKTEIGLYRLADYLGYHPKLDLWEHELPPELRTRVGTLGLSTDGARKAGRTG